MANKKTTKKQKADVDVKPYQGEGSVVAGKNERAAMREETGGTLGASDALDLASFHDVHDVPDDVTEEMYNAPPPAPAVLPGAAEQAGLDSDAFDPETGDALDHPAVRAKRKEGMVPALGEPYITAPVIGVDPAVEGSDVTVRSVVDGSLEAAVRCLPSMDQHFDEVKALYLAENEMPALKDDLTVAVIMRMYETTYDELRVCQDDLATPDTFHDDEVLALQGQVADLKEQLAAKDTTLHGSIDSLKV